MVKFTLIIAFCLVSSILPGQHILDIGLFPVPTDSSLLEIRIRPKETVVQGAYTSGVFTIRHLTSYGATITAPSALNNPLYRYGLSNQGNDGAYQYYSFSFVSPFIVNWSANMEYPIARVKLSADCQQSNAVFEIINNAWTLANNGNVYQELNGLESQDSIYQSSVMVNLGGNMLDTIPPVLTCTANQIVGSDSAQCHYMHLGNTWNAIGSDNCSGVSMQYILTGAIMDTLTTLDQAIFPIGVTQIMVLGEDGAGYQDTCFFEVKVTDDEPPVLTAPAHITVQANAAGCTATGVALGSALASDNCSGVQVMHNAPAVFPSGSTVVLWTATDVAGLTATATQTVTVQSNLAINGIIASMDTICSNDSVAVVFQIQGGTGPYTVIYKVNNNTVSLSGYEANTPVWHITNSPILFHVVSVTDALGCQVMPVSMEVSVKIRPPASLYGVTATPFQTCSGDPVLITAANLRPSQTMTFEYTLTPGGAPVLITGMSTANGTYSFQLPNQPPGTYEIIISTVSLNGCKEFYAGFNNDTFTVLPNPTIAGILMVDSTICTGIPAEIVAFGLPPDVPATFTYLINGSGASSTVQTVSTGTAIFVSSAFPEGAYTVQLTQVQVGGCSINTNFTTHFTVSLADPGCGLAIGGRVATELGIGVEQTKVTLEGIGPHGPFGEVDFTDSSGVYKYLLSVPPVSAYTLTPFKNDNPLNGVTTYDLVLISKHILALERLNSPYKMIAADANKSGSITTFDIVEIRKLILGLYQTLPNNKSWRFVDKTYVFPDSLNPFTDPIPETIIEPNLLSNALSEDFVGIKVGDVNNSAVPNFQEALEQRNRSAILINASISGGENEVRTGALVRVRFQSETDLEGLQFTLETKGLALEAVAAGKNMYLADYGDAITGSWVSEGLHDQPDFTLTFRVLSSGRLPEMLRFADRITPTEGYLKADDGAPADLHLQWEWQIPAGVKRDFFQNMPNPFAGSTKVSFTLQLTDAVNLSVMDELGRVIWTEQGIYESGIHEIAMPTDLFKTPGVYICTLETSEGKRHCKMVKVN